MGGSYIEHKAYARVGLLGNPSDVYFGRTISFSLGNFWATVRLQSSQDLVIQPHPIHDLVRFDSLNHLIAWGSKSTMKMSRLNGKSSWLLNLEDNFEDDDWLARFMGKIAGVSVHATDKDKYFWKQSHVSRLQTEGYYGGVRLLMAICKVFYKYCSDKKIEIKGGNFTLSYDTNIPRQTGLSGSSAIVCAALSCFLDFYKIRHLVKVTDRPNLILSAENELGIVAGLQDRVAQVYGGLVYMDFGKEYMDDVGHGIYTPMDIGLLPPLYLIYAENPSDSGKVHSTVRKRWLDGDKFIISSMEEVGKLPLEGREALLKKHYNKLASLMNRNFDLRRQIFGDEALGSLNIQMVETARSVGAASKFTGSGGAVIAFCPDGPSQAKLLEDACQKAGLIIQPAVTVPSFLNEEDLKTLSSQQN